MRDIVEIARFGLADDYWDEYPGEVRALDLEDIKKQYKRLAMLNHPDRSGDALKMSRINDAYRAIMSFHKSAPSR